MHSFRFNLGLVLLALQTLFPTISHASLFCQIAINDRISNTWRDDARARLDKRINDHFEEKWPHIDNRDRPVAFLRSVLFDKNFLNDPNKFYTRWVRPNEMIPRPTIILTSPTEDFLAKNISPELITLLHECDMPTTMSTVSQQWRDEAREQLRVLISSYYDEVWGHIGDERQGSINFLMAQLTDPGFLKDPRGFFVRWIKPDEMKVGMTSFTTSPAEGFISVVARAGDLHKLAALVKEADFEVTP